MGPGIAFAWLKKNHSQTSPCVGTKLHNSPLARNTEKRERWTMSANFGLIFKGRDQRGGRARRQTSSQKQGSLMEAGECCSSTSTEKRKQRQHQQQEKPYRGIRMRKWGKWVAEIREPNKRSRIWLGSYSSPVAAARAYDTAVFYLRGPSARLNFPEYIVEEEEPHDMSAASIRKKATEVGARVDAVETAHHHNHHASPEPNSSRVSLKPDLNEYPNPETSDDE